jgi:hypothetical protein
MIKVRTEIFDGHWDATTEVNVDEVLFRQAVRPLDMPAPNSPAAARMFCSDAATIKMVGTDRAVLAKKISAAITHQLLEYMAKQDTVMGYEVVATTDRNTQGN